MELGIREISTKSSVYSEVYCTIATPENKELYLLQKEGKRRCRVCDEVKILDEFATNKTTHNGILKYPQGKTTYCSKCSWSKWGKPWSQLPENKEKLSVASSKWREKESSKEWIRKRHSYRYHNDPEYKVKHLLRVRLNKALNRKKQSQSFTRELGCTFSELVVHLESQFFPDPKTGEIMTWDNHGQDGWHIDHIKPLHEFDLLDDVQLKQAAHNPAVFTATHSRNRIVCSAAGPWCRSLDQGS